MGLKKITVINEGPLDFARGAGGAIRDKVANTSIVRGAKDIVQAGRSASATADLDKAVQMLGQLLAKAVPAQQQPQQPAAQAPAQQQQPAAPQRPAQAASRTNRNPGALLQPSRSGGVASAFRSKPVPAQWTFDSYLAAIHGEKLDEGIWDFVKGAGREGASKIQDKIRAYGERPSVLKDIFNAGAKASQTADAKRASAALQQQIQQQTSIIVDIMSRMGPNAVKAVQAAIAKLPAAVQPAVQKQIQQATV